MKKLLKILIKFPYSIYSLYLKTLKFLNKRSYNYLNDLFVDSIQNRKKVINLDRNKIYIFTPNQLCEFRADTFFSKEPETINWIDKYGKKSVLYDIGANIGLYSIYHSITNQSQSYAFEPSVFNLIQLTKNININKCKDLIYVISNPLSNVNSISEFNYSSSIEGGALSSFGVDFDFEGKKLTSELTLNKLGFSIDELIENKYLIKKPNLIKIDVDGIEHLILSGGGDNLREVKEILVEVDEKFDKQFNQVNDILNNSGFRLIKKILLHNEKREVSDKQIFNQIWIKNKI